MKDGRTITGRRLNEDTFTVQLIDDKERLHSLVKSDMRSYVVETKSPMPSYAATLTGDEAGRRRRVPAHPERSDESHEDATSPSVIVARRCRRAGA